MTVPLNFLPNFFLSCYSTGEACWWTIHPASKQRSEGEKVRVGDDLILVSVSSERYLVSCVRVPEWCLLYRRAVNKGITLKFYLHFNPHTSTDVFKLVFDNMLQRNAWNICSEMLICKLFDMYSFK